MALAGTGAKMTPKNAENPQKTPSKCSKTGSKPCNPGRCHCLQSTGPGNGKNPTCNPVNVKMGKMEKAGKCENGGNTKGIDPVFPLAGDVVQHRKAVKKLISTADPVTVQIVLALLKQVDKKQRLKADYLAFWQAEKERGR
ncbi:MAG: hypothetical protein GX841_08220 [Bacteroidales bacterium]|nr:hypothetical protein [Bacteroidales bacterium]